MKHAAIISFIAFFSVVAAVFIWQSESAGLFGAIIGVGSYVANLKGGA